MNAYMRSPHRLSSLLASSCCYLLELWSEDITVILLSFFGRTRTKLAIVSYSIIDLGFRVRGVGGKILVNGKVRGPYSERWKRTSCYIQQESLTRTGITVGEAMTLAAHLKLGYTISSAYKHTQVRNRNQNDALAVIGSLSKITIHFRVNCHLRSQSSACLWSARNNHF